MLIAERLRLLIFLRRLGLTLLGILGELAKVCPAAMIFIPCRDGASHVEHEWANPGHVAAGASALAQVARDLALADLPFAAGA